MSELRRRMLEDMRLHGLSQRTRDSYVRAVAGLARHYGRSPDQLSQEEVREFFLHLREQRGASDSTVNVYLAGIRWRGRSPTRAGLSGALRRGHAAEPSARAR